MDKVEKELLDILMLLGKARMSQIDIDLKVNIVKKLNKAINYTHCCKSDSEQLKIPKTTKEQRVQLNEGYNKK